MHRFRFVVLPTLTLLVALGCAAGENPPGEAASARTAPTVPRPATVETGPPAPELLSAAEALHADPAAPLPATELERLGQSSDVRFGWDLVDLLQVRPLPDDVDRIAAQLETLTGATLPTGDAWTYFSDLLLAWDIPAPPDYEQRKRALVTTRDPATATFLEGENALDLRALAFSGAARDQVAPLDDPDVRDASDGAGWIDDDEVVFVVATGDERRVYPLRVVRSHEIVNDSVGGRRIVLTYSALCGGATAWTAEPAGRAGALTFRAPGLVHRGGQLIYDADTESLFDAFTGAAVSGPMAANDLALEPLAVLTTTWGEWRAAGIESTVLTEDAGVGRIYLPPPTSPTIVPGWPVGDRDERRPSDEKVLGVRTADGRWVAFPSAEARDRADDDDDGFAWAGARITLDGGGLVAHDIEDGQPLASQEVYWFAWSQFHPETVVWDPGS